MAIDYDTRDLYTQAHHFFEAAKVIDCKVESRLKLDLGDHIFSLTTPVAVLLAFSCELILKSLLLDERGHHKHEHGLKDLFDDLLQGTRDRITNCFCGRLNIDPSFFGQELRGVNSVFKEWRYLYDKRHGKYVNFALLKELFMSAEAILLDKHPHFRSVRLSDQG